MSIESTRGSQRTPVAVSQLVRRFRASTSGLWFEKPEAAGSINAVELDGKILERDENEHTLAWIRRVEAWAHKIHSANKENET